MSVAHRRTTQLPANPAITRPARHKAAQPVRGAAGLLFVVPVCLLLTFGAGGAENSVRVLGPLCTYALPVIGMIAFWWQDWPGTALRPGWSGLTDTLLIVAAGVVLTPLGQAVTGELDLGAIFRGEAYPHSMPLAGAVFVAFLQLTLVTEGWPLRRLPSVPAGLVALVAGWAIGLAIYRIDGALLLTMGVFQVLFYVTLRGWPFSRIANRGVRLIAGNLTVILCGWLAFLVIDALHWPVFAVSACIIAAALLASMLFESWPWTRISPRLGAVLAVLAIGALLYWTLSSVDVGLATVHRDEWVATTALNGIGTGVILHVAVWRRWPVVQGGEVTIPAPVQALLDAANANDIDAFLGGFTQEGVVDDWGREFRGAQKIRHWSDNEFIGKQVSLEVEKAEQVEDEIVVTAQVGGNGFNGPSHFGFQIDGDLVSRMTIRA